MAYPGDEIIFEVLEENTFQVYRIDVRTGALHPLPLQSPSPVRPHWSSDGSQIAYLKNEGSYDAIYVTDADRNLPRLLFSERELLQSISNYTWSPDGSQIAVATRTSLWILDVEGDHPPLSVVPYSGVEFRMVAWSPDGTRIAFSFYSSLVFYRTIIGIYDLQSGELSEVGIGDDPSWSPDGSRIVCAYGTHIVIRDVDSGTAMYVAEGFAPSWSPDGEWIAFSRAYANRVDLLLHHLPSGQSHALLSNERPNLVPVWRPLP
jgi:TolB protein